MNGKKAKFIRKTVTKAIAEDKAGKEINFKHLYRTIKSDYKNRKKGA